ncbi:hypothetical protein CASFOL_037396 [Castilleja foliolosa]|uniref:ATP-dependent DNA helicase n=1 Tax=Castilleja foliolosa TaxID=1961234 RepID=A0ABD3BN81_9LAMI
MARKRKSDYSAHEVGESSRSRRSRRLPNCSNILPAPASPMPTYFDDGDCEYICEYCAALFWFAERIVRGPLHSRPRYTHCCKGGFVRLPFPLHPPLAIKHLFNDSSFMENVRAYNNMFSMTSFGAQIDDAINDGRGPYVFKISGQISHWIGSICPADNELPRFLQLYIYDTDNEVSNRLRFFDNSANQPLLPAIVNTISDTLRSCNEYARLFKRAADLCDMSPDCNFSIRLYNNVGDRRYEPPASGTLGGIVSADDSNASKYDIVVHKKDGPPHRVSKLHPSYIPLQYPLLFPFAEPGWSPDMRLHSVSGGKRRNLTVNMYYSFQIQDRNNIYSLLLNGGRLFQQYLVDAYTCIEQSRLDFINANQNIFRSEYVAGLYDALGRGDNNARDIGKRIFLPSSFTGGPRYMYKHYHDALAICRVYGNPQYFITFTCNVKWPEICRHLDKIGGLQAQNRPDIIARVFRIKVQQFLRFMRSNRPFGDVVADLYTIEFQKRGLPHCHTLIWVAPPHKVRDAADVDKYISAEIPDPAADPVLHKIVTDLMIHGPCGLARPNSPCMRDNKCSKSFPKKFECNSRFDKDGYVQYRRRDTPYRATKNGIALDNRYVVPYNEALCRHFNAHINVEHCGWNMMIKYLFKYISKGADRVRFCITKSHEAAAVDPDATLPVINEVKNFLDGRYICPHEASWRILNFPIHERTPAVEVLAVHLQDMQNVTFKENLRLEAIIRNPSFGKTTLTEWLQSNKRDDDGLGLTYVNYSSKYRWDKKAMSWISRVHLQNPGIGRLAYVHPASGKLFYLRVLLCHQCGCKSFADIRTVSGVVHSTYRSACESLGLLGDDREWLTAFVESSSWATSSELRVLFIHMLLFCDVSQPLFFWESQWRCMGNDIRLRLTSEITTTGCFLNDADIQQCILFELEKLLHSATPSKSLTDFGIPLPSASALTSVGNRLLMEETCYDRATLEADHNQLHLLLNSDQLKVYNSILSSYHTNSQSLLFVYGHGGTGKTFLWRTIIAFFRSKGKIVLAVAASGIASLLLPAGRTAHSRFKIPIDLTDQSTCHIKKGTHLAELLRQTLLIIWDEAPMSDRRCLECLDKTLKDITDDTNHPFGGKSVLLGGDFRQTLPVKYLIHAKENRAIVCPTNDTSDEINKLVLNLTPGHCKIYNSHDVMIPHGGGQNDMEALYPQEYLNQLSFPGIPSHQLCLKINTPIILIRNINQPLGLCNGTRLIVSQLLPRIIEQCYKWHANEYVTSKNSNLETIEIRVVKKWISKGKKEELCYQFVDAYGDCIEATAKVKHIEHFDSVIQLDSCYKVSGYIAVGPRTDMATVNHAASLVIERKARFDPATNLNIPTVYFDFATYDTIKGRIKNPRLLTDYIGRVKRNCMRSTSTGKELRKTLLQNEMGTEVEITLWPEKQHLIGDEVIPGDIVAITSTLVTEHIGRLQLESTYLTTAFVNLDMPQTMHHVNRLRALPAMQPTSTNEQLVTVIDLKLMSQQNIQQGNGDVNFVCEDDDDVTPNFRYCVNATITDATGSVDTVFFNESMQAIVNMSCKDMVTKHALPANSKNVPQLLKSIIDTSRILHLTLKNDGQIVVNSVSDIDSTTDTQSTSAAPGTSTFTPTTPIPKPGTSKRQLIETPGDDKKMKRA